MKEYIVNGADINNKQLRKKIKAYDENDAVEKAFNSGYFYVRSLRWYNDMWDTWLTTKC